MTLERPGERLYRCHGFDELCYITRIYRVTRFGTAIFACVGEIRNDSDDAVGTRVAQHLQQKKESDQPLRDGYLACCSK